MSIENTIRMAFNKSWINIFIYNNPPLVFDLLLAISEDCSITYLIGCITHTKGSAFSYFGKIVIESLNSLTSLNVTKEKQFILEVYKMLLCHLHVLVK